MALTVYSKRLYAVSGLSGVGASVGPPPGFAWIVRDIDMYTGATFIGSEVHWVDDTTTGSLLVASADDNKAHSFQWQGRQVFDGITFHFETSGGPFDITVSGYELSSP